MKTASIFLGVAALLVFCVAISLKQLGEDASPAAAFCKVAERQGVACEIAPTKYESQVVSTDDGAGTQSTYLVVSDGKKILTVIPLQ